MSKFTIEIPSKINCALQTLQEAGYEAYIVGGCVRDALLGKEPHDWDITTSATPAEIQKIFRSFQQILTGIKHGTVIVIAHGEPIEITTFRIDGNYSDGRRPDCVSFTKNIVDDLARRDFSINACASNGKLLLDPFGGQNDLKDRLVRCVGNPIERFTEDALRILRGIRFASVLNFKVEEKTKKAMFACKNLLKNVSQERITVEFCKILLGSNVKDTILEFQEVFAFIIPEIKDMVSFEQHSNKQHVYDVFERSLKAVELAEYDLILRVALLFHNIAQPRFYPNQNGERYFHSSKMTETILKRMRFSNADTRIITELVSYHDTPIEASSKGIKNLLSKIGEAQFRRLLKVKRAGILAQNQAFQSDKLGELSAIEQILNEVLSKNSCFSLSDLALNGNTLVQLGIPEGKTIGMILNQLLEMVLNEEVENDQDTLLEKAKSMF